MAEVVEMYRQEIRGIFTSQKLFFGNLIKVLVNNKALTAGDVEKICDIMLIYAKTLLENERECAVYIEEFAMAMKMIIVDET